MRNKELLSNNTDIVIDEILKPIVEIFEILKPSNRVIIIANDICPFD